jgi:hypothetical protein
LGLVPGCLRKQAAGFFMAIAKKKFPKEDPHLYGP